MTENNLDDIMIGLPPSTPTLSSGPVSNSTSLSDHPSPAVGITLLVVALVVGLPGNLFVVWTVLFRLRRRSVTALLILQLAAADCLVLLTAPFFLRQLAARRVWEFGDTACRVVHYGCGVNMYVSVYLITLMAGDRLLGVSKPFVSQRVRTKSRLRPAIAAIWALALVLSIPVAVYKHVDPKSYCEPNYPSAEHEVFHYCLELVAAFVLPFIVLAVCYCRISRTLEAARVRWRRRSRRRTGRLIVLIMASFIILWVPYHLVNLLQTSAILAGEKGVNLLKICKIIRPRVIALAFLSSSINPLLYACTGSTLSGTSGLGCIARLLEGTDSESQSRRGDSQGDRGNAGEQNGESLRMGHIPAKEKNDQKE
ncbi:leukotriene B4 receptor 1-like isoform X1 [Brienomyrus brachyistius]|uniref:leukotriene B4 receptor 1-like isoform X1 n=2 Tax=Brienomyrus brachyistius TaxID=42636 RepID=UPI0020B260E5|nr:leukotriene B4 receptor 1-like isoform X1 [Brienomyrus brachyistius]XP_048826901.1 leukotriene B4 receptor 1-like isoform X1 [Brienomyrus brachyistius]XP_048826902.1 leukotriene B4 receptor 1-like isoform X1 [Brienomyrus brachyistius]XP_048826903.1 leukotriene B4 receptor 1-like isoform X1 [Brienomyrus brachyistius]XP_048826904.1 leukotriene B4 receptor 1-like isoform X1 [Brienomyrus brachyistius]XP_048826905.1 leukotriene B4 receptor 1-like isoform X1 [Brienomyrus brachyistius]XP_04882690